MFLGDHEYRIDPQGRVPIPPRFRADFLQELVATRGYDRCIVLFTSQEWTRFSSGILNMSLQRHRHRELARVVFGGAFNLKLDGQGRILLPVALRNYAGIRDEVMVVGAGNYVEIWDGQAWSQEIGRLEESAWHIAETTGGEQ